MAQKPVTQPVPTPNVPPVQSPQSTPWILIIVIIVLVALFAVVGTYLFMSRQLLINNLQKSSVPTPAVEVSGRTLRNTVKPGTDWLTYTDDQAGFSLQYPPTVDLNGGEKGSTRPSLGISVEKIDDIALEMPLGMDRSTAIADKEALQKGKAQTIGDFASSDALISIDGKLNGRMNSVLSRFEICSVIFSRSLTFYPNNYRVIVSLGGVEDVIVKSMPEYFTVDPNNCGEMTMWIRSADKMGQFLPRLSKGEGSGAGQEWYDTFDGIIQTIKLLPVSASAVSSSTPTVTPTVGATSTPTPSCEVRDGAFCNVLSDIKNSMAANNFAGIVAYQTTTPVTCDPDGMAISICDGKAKGVVVEGYGVGYNQSEGNILTKDVHLASLASYVANNGPFFYKGSYQQGDKGVIVYLNGNASNLFVLFMKRAGATWRFSTVLIGGVFGDTAFATVSPTLLDRVQ